MNGSDVPAGFNHGSADRFDGGMHGRLDGSVVWMTRDRYPDFFYWGTPSGPYSSTGTGTFCHQNGGGYDLTWYWVTEP